jgi:hypothetical protein
MGVRLPGWGREDEERIVLASSISSSHGHSHPLPTLTPTAARGLRLSTPPSTPIRDLPGLSSLPPPLIFTGTPPPPASPIHAHAPPLHSPSQGDASHSSVGGKTFASYSSAALHSTSAILQKSCGLSDLVTLWHKLTRSICKKSPPKNAPGRDKRVVRIVRSPLKIYGNRAVPRSISIFTIHAPRPELNEGLVKILTDFAVLQSCGTLAVACDLVGSCEVLYKATRFL